jgi:hypothetical protein
MNDFEAHMPTHDGRSLILLSCSRAKRGSGRLFDSGSRQIVGSLGNQRSALSKTRKQLLRLLRGQAGRLYDEDQKGGFRDLRPCNRQLFEGPDFGASISDQEIYLPAHERYCGRFFDQLTRESPEFWKEIRGEPVEIIFVSGLYGLLLWDELIQDYDCHLSDYTRNGKELHVWELWQETLTAALSDFIREARRAAPITIVYDLLSEEEYQRAFDWNRLDKLGVEIRHCIFRDSHGPDVLTDIATLLARQFIHFLPNHREGFALGKAYDFAQGKSQVRFEHYPFTDLDHIELSLMEMHPALNRIPPETLKDFARAEALWGRIHRTRNMPVSAVVLLFAAAVEGFIRSTIPALKGATLGEAIQLSRRGDAPEIGGVLEELKTLNRLRNQAAHRHSYDDPKVPLNKGEVREAQRLAYYVVERLAQKS